MLIVLIVLASFAYLQIGYRIGHASHVLWKACASNTEAPERKRFSATVLFPSHAHIPGTWDGGDFPILVSLSETPEMYGLLLALAWPIKAVTNLFCCAVLIFASLSFKRIIDAIFRPEKLFSRAADRRGVGMATKRAGEPVAVSPATRIDEINTRVGTLLAEKEALERRPDAARL